MLLNTNSLQAPPASSLLQAAEFPMKTQLHYSALLGPNSMLIIAVRTNLWKLEHIIERVSGGGATGERRVIKLVPSSRQSVNNCWSTTPLLFGGKWHQGFKNTPTLRATGWERCPASAQSTRDALISLFSQKATIFTSWLCVDWPAVCVTWSDAFGCFCRVIRHQPAPMETFNEMKKWRFCAALMITWWFQLLHHIQNLLPNFKLQLWEEKTEAKQAEFLQINAGKTIVWLCCRS